LDYFKSYLIFLILASSLLDAKPIRNFPLKEKKDLPKFYTPQESDKMVLPAVPKDDGIYKKTGKNIFKLHDVKFEGNSVFSDEELLKVTKDFLNKDVSLSDIEEIRYQLTRYYTDRGYTNSGAIIKPNQTIDKGLVLFELKEGRLGDVIIAGVEGLNPEYIKHRIWPDKDMVFNTNELQKNFQLLLNDPLVESMNGSLVPTDKKDSAALNLKVTRSRPYSLKVTADNSGTPSTGSERIGIDGIIRNLTGHGDYLEIIARGSEGYKSIKGDFFIPIDRYNTKLGFSYTKAFSNIIEKPLDTVDIESEYESYEISITHPIWVDLYGQFILGGSIMMQENHNTLGGKDYPLSRGEELNGKSKITAITIWQDYQLRESDWVLAARSTFNVGTSLLNSTVYGDRCRISEIEFIDNCPDSQYLSWIAQLQYAKRVLDNSQLVLRTDVQLSSDRLLPMAKFSLGGYDTVRGYRENALVRDNGYLVSAEFRYSVLQSAKYGSVNLIPFIDYGFAWNYKAGSDGENLLGMGVGLGWSYKDKIDANIFFASDIKKAPAQNEHNLQDDGIHFRVTYNVWGL